MARSANERYGRYNRDDDMKPPKRDGETPRPATEPDGAERIKPRHTLTDPVTGEPLPPSS